MAKQEKTITYYESIGRRKSAVARVRLYLSSAKAKLPKELADAKKGEIYANHKLVEDYFPGDVYKKDYLLPLNLTDNLNRFIISTLLRGGGIHGQLDALKLGISRALEMVDADNRAKLKPAGLLKRDARVRERRKVGTGGKARRQKQSPKR
ncbi:30S ribosomal protein S9 [Candidatus Woesebacteria bacterium]|jgi:small subunit ribosomal protein S9|nr:30S ribosomal protein S9 [Candidatus Woesebacteria bacterium]